MKYIVKGYTGPNPDFTDEVELPAGFDFEALLPCGDPRYNAALNVIYKALADTDCPPDYLEVLEGGEFEPRDDLADDNVPGQLVLCGEGSGCDNCAGQGHNDYTDGCNDEVSHGGFLLTFDPAEGCTDCKGPVSDLDGYDGLCGTCADATRVDCDQAKGA